MTVYSIPTTTQCTQLLLEEIACSLYQGPYSLPITVSVVPTAVPLQFFFPVTKGLSFP